MKLYDQTALECGRLITKRYSTSFSLGIRSLHPRFRLPICGIYGFVRLADEIVDTFKNCDNRALLARFRADTFTAISEKISLNPVLHAFQLCVNKYGIDHALINAFLDSMAMDLDQNRYDESGYKQYIFGSAEAVGLMCLHVFCEGDMETYSRLESSAKSLGAAFQKVNFLRDIRSDFDDRGRVYFPATDFNTFDAAAKACVEADIKADFEAARIGILQLPTGARSGVWLAYAYYCRLFRRIAKLPASEVLTKRIRVPDSEKLAILVQNWCLSPFRYAR